MHYLMQDNVLPPLDARPLDLVEEEYYAPAETGVATITRNPCDGGRSIQSSFYRLQWFP
jgi:hypothetical protein